VNQVVAQLSQLPEVGAVRVVVSGVPVAVVRDAFGDVHAISDVCTHADVSLAEGDVEGATIECWLHGSQFDLVSGKPLSLPAIRPVPVYPVTIVGDDVLVDISSPKEN
jgi:3-phenylpropionate/trans-cinnamate dioxygenase ferredoxin component